MDWQALANIVGIGRATAVDDTGQLQLVQVTEGATGSGFADRITDKVTRTAEFGFSSSPPLESEVVMLRVAADRSGSIIISTSHRPSRPTGLQPGDTALYDVRGAIIKLSAAGMTIDAAGLPIVIQNASKITLDSPEVEMTGKLTVAGDITASGDINVAGNVTERTSATPISLGTLRDAYEAHKHTGVQTGSGSTGATDHPA